MTTNVIKFSIESKKIGRKGIILAISKIVQIWYIISTLKVRAIFYSLFLNNLISFGKCDVNQQNIEYR